MATAVSENVELCHGLSPVMRSVHRSSTASRSRRREASYQTATGHTFTEDIHTAKSYLNTFTGFFLYAVLAYVDLAVSVFHVCYFSYRKSSLSKDLIRTAFHLMKISYDNSLLSLREIIDITKINIIGPMARQNQHYFVEENMKTSHLRTMKTSTQTHY